MDSQQQSNEINQAFMPKINYALDGLRRSFDNKEFVKAEKYLKVIQELYTLMMIAIKGVSDEERIIIQVDQFEVPTIVTEWNNKEK